MKRLLHLVIFLAIFWCFCVSDMDDKKKRYNKCIKSFKSGEIYLYSFKRNESDDIGIYALSVFEKVDAYLQDAILTCICRDTYDPIFFISPYINFKNNKTAEDVYFYCVLGKPAIQNINDSYNDYEIYDNFLFEYIKTIPNTLMTPLKYDDNSEDNDSCYDENGYPTKSIGNQQTCFFAFTRKDDSVYNKAVYSGPLIYSQLSTFGPNVGNFTLEAKSSCYTSVKNTTFKPNDSCIYIPYDSVFLCCCSEEHKNCRIQKEKLYCFPRDTSFEWFKTNVSSFRYKRISVQTYLNESVNYACGIKISTVTVQNTESNETKFKAEHISLNSCSEETTIDISESESGFCSSKAEKPQNIEIQKCCKSDNFCNLRFTPINLDKLKNNTCAYKPDISLYFDKSNTCELYYDLTLEKRVYLHENFTTKIINRTLYDEYPLNITYKLEHHYVSYRCSYIHAEIIHADSQNCSEQSYNETGLIKPFYHCTCQNFSCDAKDNEMFVPKTNFTCQHLVKTDFKNAKNGVENLVGKDKWICYVQIDFYFEGSKINAGHFDIEKDKNIECLVRDIYQNDFCCVSIVNIKQKDTDCTVEKLIKRYNISKHGKRNPSENHDANSEYITCLSKDILNTEAEICPKTGGCFSTRILLPSGITSTDAIEPAGCLGYAEKYATLNLPLTSLSLGCRTNENSNRCSVVYGPNGEQRIVCCCNENDGNGFCNTNLKEVPQSVGRSIKSFKSLN